MLAILEGVQKHLQQTFLAEEIESGILEGLLIESDYDVICLVSFLCSNAPPLNIRSTLPSDMLKSCPILDNIC